MHCWRSGDEVNLKLYHTKTNITYRIYRPTHILHSLLMSKQETDACVFKDWHLHRASPIINVASSSALRPKNIINVSRFEHVRNAHMHNC